MKPVTKHTLFFWLLLACCINGMEAKAQTITAFTYQGRLTENGAPANGSYEFRFELRDAAAAGAAVGNAVTNSAVAVSNGVFTVAIDFGASPFTGAARWLEIGVRSNGVATAFTTLSPRQAITAAPYAVYALTPAGPQGPQGPAGLQGVPGPQGPPGPADASAITNGTLADARLSANVPLKNANNVFTGSNTFNGPVSAAGFAGAGALPWQAVSNPSLTASPNTGYLLTNAGQTTVTLPTAANVGDIVRVAGAGAGGWQVVPGSGQDIEGSPAGAVWIPRESSRDWYAVASSADGTKLVAAVLNGQIFTSTDSGVTWVPREANRYWTAVASSSDGTRLVAAADAGQIYTSSDAGVTWTPRDTNRYWTAVASASDGIKLVAVVDAESAIVGGQIHTSTDAGVTWTARGTSLAWHAVASSADGTKLVASGLSHGAFAGGIFTSTDSGVTWVSRGAGLTFRMLASSADGAKLVGVRHGGQIYTSSDSGVTWVPRESNRFWMSVASSADGSRLVAAVGTNGQIYITTDSGTNWTARESARDWRGVASSSDGKKLVAVGGNSQIYTSTQLFPIGGSGTTASFQFLGNGVWQPLRETQLAAGSVDSSKILDGSVTVAKLANNSVGTAQLQDGAVTTPKLAFGAVTSGQLAAGSVNASHLADGTITTNKLAPSTLAALGGLPSGTMLFSDSTNGGLFQSAGYQPVPGYNLPLGGWAAIQVNSPKPEYEAFKVGWTGSELILGGLGPTPGAYGGISLFNPNTGMWRTGTTNGSPPYQNNSPNSFGGVWTGSEVFTFGEVGISGPVGFGRYNPATDTWGVLNTNGAPPIVGGGDGAAISYPALVWTGTEAILFGNTNSGSAVGAAGRYHPGSNLWNAVSQVGFPQPNSSDGSRFAVWTGAEVFYLTVTSGAGGGVLGGLYSPTTNLWRSFNTVGAPTNGSSISAVLTASNEVAVLVPQYLPPAFGTPVAMQFFFFNPASNTWRTGSTNNSPTSADSVFWTGSEIGVTYRTGGITASEPKILNVAFYHPGLNVWRTFAWDAQHTVRFYERAPATPQAALAVWTGLDVLLTGRIAGTNSAGMATGTYPNELFRFTPIRTLLLYQRP